ncbi:MAG: PEGA domain-containing protein [Treponemataceae bacterium]
MKKNSFCLLFFIIVCINVSFAQISITDKKIPTNDDVNKAKVLTPDIVTYIESDTGSLLFKSDIQNIEVYINHEFYGRTNLFVAKLIPGIYTIKMVKIGYYDYTTTVEVTAGEQKTFLVDLNPMSGILEFQIKEQNAKIFVDGKTVVANLIELPEGTYPLEVSLFGFVTINTTISVIHNVKRTVTVNLEKAAFSVRNFRAEPKSFNPSNAGNLGKAKIAFWVSSEGNATLTIRDKDATDLAIYHFPPFTTWEQSFLWIGKTSSGSTLTDGEYDIELMISSIENPQEKHTLHQKIIIDTKINYPFLSTSANGGSIGLVSSSQLYPAKTIYSSFSILPAFTIENVHFISSPIVISVLGSPLSFLELFGSFAIIPASDSTISLYGGGGIKMGSSINNFFYSGFVRYAYHTKSREDFALETGLGTGISLGFTYRALHVDFASEYIFGQTSGLLVPFESSWTVGLSLKIQDKFFALGIWSKLYNSIYLDQVLFADLFSSGLELSFLIPNTNMILKTGYMTSSNDSTIWTMRVLASLILLF